MSSRSWRTRAEQQTGAEAPQQEQPAKTPANDLAALQRQQQRPRRQRESVARQQAAERERRQRRLTRKAEREQDLSALRRLASNSVLHRALAGLVVVLLVVLVAIPQILHLLNPPLSRHTLDQNRRQVDAVAYKLLGAQPNPPHVRTSADGKLFLLDYRVPAGRELFRGGRARSACRVVLSVDRASASASALAPRTVSIRRCQA